ncbi:MAG: hypothetical protein ACE5GI_07815, partial [Candidatus Aminicenantales bacterium]
NWPAKDNRLCPIMFAARCEQRALDFTFYFLLFTLRYHFNLIKDEIHKINSRPLFSWEEVEHFGFGVLFH